MRRDIQSLVSRLAAQEVYDERGASEMGVGQDLATETVVAPAIGEWATLSEAPLVPDTLELVAASLDGALYWPDTDYYEDASTGSFQNLRIPAGTVLTATYHHEELFAEEWREVAPESGWTGNPMVYREGSRAYLRGVLAGGSVAVGTVVLSVPPDYAPDAAVSLPTMTDAGPIVVEVSAVGTATIGDGPFEAGNGWLALDGLSWRYEVARVFGRWGQEDTTFARLVTPYGRLFYAWGEAGIALADVTSELRYEEFSDFEAYGGETAKFRSWGQTSIAFALLDASYHTAYGKLFYGWGEAGIPIAEITATYERLD